MARVKGAMMTRKRRNKTLKLAKCYWGSKSKHFKMAKQAVKKSGVYAYVGRKQKKRSYPQPVDHPAFRRRGSLRPELFPLHERREEGRHRDEPQEPVRDGHRRIPQLSPLWWSWPRRPCKNLPRSEPGVVSA